MGIQLNIKSAEASNLAKQLADTTGESLKDAVVTALRERLQRVRRLSDEELVAKWTAIGKENCRRFPDMPGSADIDALLYDAETGLPK